MVGWVHLDYSVSSRLEMDQDPRWTICIYNTTQLFALTLTWCLLDKSAHASKLTLIHWVKSQSFARKYAQRAGRVNTCVRYLHFCQNILLHCLESFSQGVDVPIIWIIDNSNSIYTLWNIIFNFNLQYHKLDFYTQLRKGNFWM